MKHYLEINKFLKSIEVTKEFKRSLSDKVTEVMNVTEEIKLSK